MIISLAGCRNAGVSVNDPLVVSWTSYEEENGAIALSWTSSGGESGHRYLLQRLSVESDWLPEDGVQYASGGTPGLLYSGSEQFYKDSSVIGGKVYYYRLFVADVELLYSDPITITMTMNPDGLSVIEAPLLQYIRQMNYYIDIGWEGAGTDTAGYIIARSEFPISWNPQNGTGYSAGESITETSIVWTGQENRYSDTNVIDGKAYYYKIFAYNSDYLYSAGLHSQLVFEAEPNLAYQRFPWVDNYMIYYGALTSEAINTAKNYDLVIIHPSNNGITRDQVRQIQRGFNSSDPSDDVLVIAYVAVGEDLRTTQFYPVGADVPLYDLMAEDPRFVRNGIGPRVDPRGPMPDGGALLYNYSIGNKSQGGTGFASYYLDDNDVVNGVGGGLGDGKPDFNNSWRGAFVNAGDPLWFQEVDQMRYENDGVFGLQELFSTTIGEGLGVDGIFMDAMDTFAPNGWTSNTDLVQTEFEWTAPGFADFIKRLKDKYPNKIVIQNRAVFLFRPGLVQQYLRFNSRPYIDFLLFESFRLDSSSDTDYNEQFYFDNRYNYAPPLLAEAGREDGFQVLSLGYAEGSTLSGFNLNSGAYKATLIEDIVVTQNIGFRHYFSKRSVDDINTYVLEHGDWTDTSPPAWTSVYNENKSMTPPGLPSPRYGLLKAEPIGAGKIRVYWDLAQDRYPVDYYLYYSTSPLDFFNNSQLEGIRRLKLTPRMPDDYKNTSGTLGDNIFPFYDDMEGFDPGVTYYLCIRAVDRSANRNMDNNTSTLFLEVN